MKLSYGFRDRPQQVSGSSTRWIVACLLVTIHFSFVWHGRAQNRTTVVQARGETLQGGFTPTGTMNRARYYHTATLLQDGRVLIAGGADYGYGNYIDSAELYDPNTGTFIPTGRMNWARGGHTAVLLPNGKVLVAGSGPLELYDPATGAFSPTGDMGLGRLLSRAILLQNGKVLLAGPSGQALLYDPPTGTLTSTGNISIGWIASENLLDGRVLVLDYINSEVYNPATGAFIRTGSLSKWASVVRATALENGQVLVTGGENPDDVYDKAELFDPNSGTFSLTGNMNDRRILHTSTLLPDGAVLIAGGQSWYSALHRSAELYDPAAGKFNRIDEMTIAHSGHTATLLENGQVLIAGGWQRPCFFGCSAIANAELYTPRFEISPIATNASIDPANVRLGGAFTATFSGHNLTNETYFDVRFRDPDNFSDQEALNWQRGPVQSHTVPNSIVPGRWVITGVRAHQDVDDHSSNYFPVSASVVVSSLIVADLKFDTASVLAGGTFRATFSGTNLNSETYFDIRFRSPGNDTDQVALNWQRGESFTHNVPIDAATGIWTITGVWAHQNESAHSTDFTPALVSIAVATSPGQGGFSRTGDMAVARTNHTATLLLNGRVLIAGGGTGSQPGYFSSAELYDPATGSFTLTGSFNRARAGHTATLLPNGKVLIAGGVVGRNAVTMAELYDPDTETFVPTGQMIMGRSWHTATLVSGGKVLIAGGPIQAELYNPATGEFELGSPPTVPGQPLLGGMVIPSATVLSDRTILLSGPSSETYDPSSDTFARAGNMATPSYGHTATLLSGGKVLIAGGIWEDEGQLARAELYDPATRTFTRNGNMTTSRNQHTATPLINGIVLITGGEDGRCSIVPPPCSGATLSSYELYDSLTGTFVAAGTMSVARQGHTATVLNDGRVLVTGGTTASAEVYSDRSR